MFGLEKKKVEVPKPKSYVVKTTITKGRDDYNVTDEWTVIVEGSGFTGEAKAYSLSSAFERAYVNLMSQVSETIFKEEE